MPEPTISLRELRGRPAIWYPACAPLTERELLALVEAVEATQGPEGCTFCGKPAMVSHANHREDCPVARFRDFTEEGT